MLFIFLWPLTLGILTFSHILSFPNALFAQNSLHRLLFWLENLYSCPKIPHKLTFSQDFSTTPSTTSAQSICLDIGVLCASPNRREWRESTSSTRVGQSEQSEADQQYKPEPKWLGSDVWFLQPLFHNQNDTDFQRAVRTRESMCCIT